MAAYKAADRSGNGFVERREFGYFLRYIVYYNNLWALFSAVDDDGDRRISKEEFVQSADKLDGLNGDAETVFSEIDANGGGIILFDELCHWMAVNKSTWGVDDAEVAVTTAKIDDVEESTKPDARSARQQEPKPVVAPEAVKSITIPAKKEALALFDSMDGNGSGKLSLAELDKGVLTLFSDKDFNHKPAIMAAYKAADRSGNGFVERREFGYFLRYIVYYNNLWALFSAVDDDGDRRISKEEFVQSADKLDGLNGDAETVFSEIDANGGGIILFDELCHWMAVNKSTWGVDDAEVAATTAKIDAKEAAPIQHSEPEKQAEPELIPEAVQNIAVPPKAEAMALFDSLDPNSNGRLSLAELDKGIIQCYPQFNNKPAIMAAYKAADRNGDGFIRRSEFGFFLRFIQYYNNLWHVFEGVDTDGDRRITKEEFEAAQLELNGNDAAQVFDEMDKNGGGKVLFGELCQWMATNKSDWAVGAKEDEVF